MLVATQGQTASYSTLHNNTNNGGGTNSAATSASATKKASALSSSNATTSGMAKSLNSNNNHTSSIITTKNSLNSSTHSTTFNNHTNPKHDNGISNKISNQNKNTATSSREIISSTIPAAAAAHCSKNENSTNTINSKHQSFIQTLKDSVQKALISTTGSSGNINSIVSKHPADNKLKSNCNNSTTSINNVTSSSSSASHNAKKISTTTTSNTSSNLTAAPQSSSSVSVVRSKYLSCSLSKLHTVAPTVIHRFPEERQHASSTDSLQKEMCHFKPIRIVPKTPWKSGSKSRGNCLRFPKANLATKRKEFVLKSNCDVNNRKKKKQQNRTQNDKNNVDEIEERDDNEQENKELHGIYKPKPSLTCLSASITTPNHQSAFVCLVAQMKNLVNVQSKRQLIPNNTPDYDVGEVSDDSLKELYQRKTQKSAKKQQKNEETLEELPKIRSTRLSSSAVKYKRVSNTTATSQDDELSIPKISTARITKAKSRRKLGSAKSKTNQVALSTPKSQKKLQNSASLPAVSINRNKTSSSTASRNTKKRKTREVLNDFDQQHLIKNAESTASTSLQTPSRKSSRLSAGKSSVTTNALFKKPTNQIFQQTTKKSSVVCFSPPLTRSRLKRLTEQGKIVTTATADIKKRRI